MTSPPGRADAPAASAAPTALALPAVACPACGGANAPGAAFCADPACRKALGPFRYVLEELRGRARWHERLADRIVGFMGNVQFIGVHVAWFLVWAVANTGLVMLVRPFDAYPFGLLGLLLGIEAILLTGFVLISQNRERAHDDLRAELDYELAVTTHRRLDELEELVRRIAARLDGAR